MIPHLVLSDNKGNIFVHESLKVLGKDFSGVSAIKPDELIVLPKGSTLLSMPGHIAIGLDETCGTPVRISHWRGRKVFPVAAFMIPGFTRLYLPAAQKADKKIILPLWPYTAVGYYRGKFYAAGVMVDSVRRQRPFYYKQVSLLKKNIESILKEFPKNRLFGHLSHCAIAYNCRNAQNLFLNRWEAPLPVSPACNARCIGCLSFQESDCSSASHERIRFVPTAQEVFEVGLRHLKYGRNPMVSFGQGCEGEPLLQFEVIKESILLMRCKTKRGVIHLNTNGFNPQRIALLAAAGMDSVRVSINSLTSEIYDSYYRPHGYCFKDVLASIKIAKESGLFVSLNFLTFPGYSDTAQEASGLARFLKKGFVDLLQLRNLSIDPEFFQNNMPQLKSKPMGMLPMISLLKKECPKLRFGYFNSVV